MLDVSCTFNHAPCTIRLPVDNHDNWYRGVTETFYRSKFVPCRYFSPSQNGELMFNIKNTGSDDLLLESVKVYFEVLGSLFDGSKVKAEDYPTLSFTWNGLHWFNNGNQDSWHSFEQEQYKVYQGLMMEAKISDKRRDKASLDSDPYHLVPQNPDD